MKVNLKFKVKVTLAPQNPYGTGFSVPGRLLSQKAPAARQRQRPSCASRSPSPGAALPLATLFEDWVAFSVPCPAEKNVKMNYPEEISTLAQMHLGAYHTKRVQTHMYSMSLGKQQVLICNA